MFFSIIDKIDVGEFRYWVFRFCVVVGFRSFACFYFLVFYVCYVVGSCVFYRLCVSLCSERSFLLGVGEGGDGLGYEV